MKKVFQSVSIILLILTNSRLCVSQINSSSFAPYISTVIGNIGSINVAVGDIDQDGKNDVVVANEAIGKISIFRNLSSPGNISFGPRIDSMGGANSCSIHIKDMDGDGRPDIVVSTGFGASVAIYRNLSTPGNVLLSSKQSFLVSSGNAWGIWVEDLDNDSKPDILIGNSNGNTFSILRNTSTNGSINFASEISFTNPVLSSPSQVMISDLNADGLGDLIFFNNSGNNIILIQNTSSTSAGITFSSITTTLNANTGPHRGDIADIDGDGKLDIIASNFFSQNTSVYRNTSSNGSSISFASKIDLTAASTGIHSSIISDLDKDGKPELIQSCGSSSSTSKISVFKNYSKPGTLVFGTRIDFSTETEPRGIAIGDIDGDGVSDIVTANYSSINFSVLRSLISPSYGMVANYTFNANTLDFSGHGNHGSAATGISNSTDRFSKPNSSYYFNGNLTSSYISVAANPSLDPSLNLNMTYMLWFKPETLSTSLSRRILNHQDASNRNYEIIYDYQNKKLQFLNFNGSSASVSIISSTVFLPNTWNHVVVQVDSNNNTKLWINGVLEATSVNTISRPNNPILNIGRHPTYNWNFHGNIDDLKIYARVLSPSDIFLIYNSEKSKLYYSKPSGNLNQLSTWGENPDGTGPSPLSFDSANTTYYVHNNPSPVMGGSLKLNGANSRLVIGDGTTPFNLAVSASDTLSCDSIYINNHVTLTVQGLFATNKLNSSSTSSTVQYLSTGTQLVASGIYNNLFVNGSVKTLSGNTLVKSTLGMVASINTSGFELTLGTDPINRGTLNRVQGTIIGKFTRWFGSSTNSGVSGLFPVGTAGRYAPFQLDFTTAPSAGGAVSAEFISSAPGNVGLPILDFSNGFVFIDKTAIDGYWKVSSSIASGTFDASVTANNFAGVNDHTTLRLLKRSSSGSWNTPGTAFSTSGSNTSAIAGRSGLSGVDAEYTIGSDQSQNPLPVQLVSFDGRKLNNMTSLLNWKTSSEVNSDRFIVQRLEGTDWTNRVTVAAKGHSNTMNTYSAQDDIRETSGVLYYRLQQIDFNGDRSFSRIISLSGNVPENRQLVVYPNPASSFIVLRNFTGSAVIYDSKGTVVQIVDHEEAVDIAYLPAGLYLIKTADQTVRFIKQ